MEATSFISFLAPTAFLLLLLLLLSPSIHTTMAATTASSKSNSLKTYKSFIKTSCNSTTHPSLCYKHLSSYASTIKTDPLKLRTTALTLNLKAARQASELVASVAKKRGGLLTRAEKGVIGVCKEEIAATVDELKRASVAMANLRGATSEKDGQISNIRTWVSAAMTNEGTCMDGFEEFKVRRSVKDKIRKMVMDLGKITSNTLALVTSFRY